MPSFSGVPNGRIPVHWGPPWRPPPAHQLQPNQTEPADAAELQRLLKLEATLAGMVSSCALGVARKSLDKVVVRRQALEARIHQAAEEGRKATRRQALEARIHQAAEEERKAAEAQLPMGLGARGQQVQEKKIRGEDSPLSKSVYAGELRAAQTSSSREPLHLASTEAFLDLAGVVGRRGLTKGAAALSGWAAALEQECRMGIEGAKVAERLRAVKRQRWQQEQIALAIADEKRREMEMHREERLQERERSGVRFAKRRKCG